MPSADSLNSDAFDRPIILLTGATGYVGSKLIPLLEQQPITLRCLVRNRSKLRPLTNPASEVVEGDVLDQESLKRAMAGVDTAYYLVHLMVDAKNFEEQDRQAAINFSTAAKNAGVKRIIYLGGLGDDNDRPAAAAAPTPHAPTLRSSAGTRAAGNSTTWAPAGPWRVSR